MRASTIQGLEIRQLLSASIQVWDGGTQLTSGSTESFGTVTVGQSDSKTLTIKDTGDALLTISSASTPTGYSVQNSFPINVNAGQSTTLTVSLNTSSSGSFSGPLNLQTNDPSHSTFSLNLSGNVSPSSGNGTLEVLENSQPLSNGANDSFGSVTVGSTDTKSYTLENVGQGTLTVSSLSLPSGFSSTTSFPMSLSPYQSATLSVSMSTSAAGNFSGSMLIQSSDTSHNPFTINVSGTVTSATSPVLGLRDGSTIISNNGSDSFGSVTTGTSDTRTYTVSNNGAGTLTVSAVSLPNGYSLQATLPINVTAGNSSTFVVALDTTTAGTFSGTMAITSNDGTNNPFDVSISGTVTAPPAPLIQIKDGSTAISNGGSDSFGTVTQGASASKTFTVNNTGTASLSITAISAPAGFSLQTTLPITISAGGSGSFVVALDTSTVATESGTLAITSNDTTNNPFDISLSGTVVAPAPLIQIKDGSTTIANGGSSSWGTVTQGTSASKTYTVNNTGTASLSITAISAPAGFSLQSALPITVSAGGSSSFVVALDTSTVATDSGTLAITSNDTSNNPFDISLSATVTASSTPAIQLKDGPTTVPNGGSISLGTVPAGSTDTKTITVNNIGGGGPLTISAISLPGGFSLQTALPINVNAGGSGSFVVALNTSSAATYSGTMLVTSNDPAQGRFSVSLGGTVTAVNGPTLQLYDGSTLLTNNSSDNLPPATVGAPASASFVVSNTGTATLNISAISLPTGFSLVGSLPIAVAPQQSGGFTVNIDTSVAASLSGPMVLTSDDSQNSPLTVNLSCTVSLPTVTLAATTPTADEESGSSGVFTVSRTGSTANPLTVSYSVGGTAPANVDYTALTGSVTIPAGAATTTITVNPLDDGDVNQVRQIVLPDATGGSYTLAIGDETTTALAFNADSSTVAAALAGLAYVGAGRVAVTGSGTSADPFIATFYGPLGGPELPALTGDGSLLTGGSTTITTSVVTPGDDGGTVAVTLATSSAYTVGSPNEDTVTIVDNEPPVATVVATTPQADEVAATSGTFTVYRDGPITSALTLDYELTGTAVNGVDFDWLSGSVTIPAGQASAPVIISPLNNGLAGADTSVVLTLVPPPAGPHANDYTLAPDSPQAATSATVTIVNHNLPVLTIVASTPQANEETATPGEFTVTRNGLIDQPLTLTYTVAGTGVSGTDYQPLTGTVTIPAGQASATIDVTPIDDGTPAGGAQPTSSTVVVSLASSADYTINSNADPVGDSTGGSATVTILDDDLPQVSITASAPLAVESTAAPGAFTISIDSAQATDLTIPYTVSGSAISGTDYQPLTGGVTIPAGQTSAVVSVVPLNDPAEFGFTTVEATLGTRADYELTALKFATVSIVGNMSVPALTLSVTTPVADEVAGTSGEFTITRGGSTASPLTAYYTIAGTAVDGTDYDLLPGSVTIPAGQASTTILITPMSDAAMQDSSRTVTLTLTNYGGPSGASYSIGNPAGGTVTIDDLPTVSIQATTPTAEEHEGTAGVFTVTRANDPLQATQALTVTYTIDGTATGGVSYQALSGSVTIPAGEAITTIDVTPIDAGLVGGSQTVALALSAGGYLIGSAASDTVTINDDDPPSVSIVATTPTADEASGAAGVFTVTRNGPTTDPLTVSYDVSGTAVAGVNYQALAGSVTIAAGQASTTIDAAPLDLGQVGGTTTVIASLVSGAGYVLGSSASDTVTILEDDLPTVTLTATQPHATESGTTGTFTVTRNGLTTDPLIVLYTVTGDAVGGADYQMLSGNVTIPAGQPSATITVTPINDPLVESDQAVTLTLASTSQYVTGSQRSDTVTIFDDNPPSVTVAAAANADEEASAAGTFTVTRIGPTDNPLTVSYTVGGTAQSAADFQSLAGSVTIPAGEASAAITVTPIDDGAESETQQIIVPAATGGTYTLSIDSDSTAALPYYATASTVQTALSLLPEVGTGNVTVSGQGNSDDPFLVTFAGGLIDVSVPLITGDASQLTGTTGVSVTTTTPGQRGINQVEQVGYTAASGITGGTFTLSYPGGTTAALAYDASAGAVQSALEVLPGIGAGNVAVTALATGPDTYTWQITFQGALAAQDLPQVTTDPSLITAASGGASADDSIISTGSTEGGIDAVQQVALANATGGTFTLTYQGATTVPIAFDADAATVASDLEALTPIGMNNVSVSGDAGGPWSVTFQGALADQNVPSLTADGSALIGPAISTSIISPADGDSTVVLTLSASSDYTIGTLATVTASGGTGPSDTVTIADNDKVAPTVVPTEWSVTTGQSLSVAASGVLVQSQDPGGAAITAVLLTGVSHGSLTLNADGSFTYTPDASFQGTDYFVFQGFDGSLYSAPAIVTLGVAPAPAPEISVTSSGTDIANGTGSIAFGQTTVGTPVTESITITNGGTADLTLPWWSAPSGFTVITAPAADLAAGDSTTMTVRLDATAAGSYGGTFSLDDNVAGEDPFTFTLSGTVSDPAPALEVLQGSTVLVNGSPSGFSFGTTGQAEPVTDQFQVTNTGSADLTLSDPISLPAGFTLVDDFGSTTLAPGASTTFSVELTADSADTYSGDLSFTTNDANNSTYSLPITGTVVAGPIIAVFDDLAGGGTTPIANGSTTSVNFGTALLGSALTQTLTIENDGTQSLTLDPAQLVLPAGFSVLTPYATSVAPGDSTTLVLQLSGATAGVFSGTVTFPTNDVGNSTFTFQVSGEIDTPEPQIEILQGTTVVAPGNGTVDFGSTDIGAPVDETMTVENVGTADLTIDQNMRLPSGYRLVSLGATTLAPGASTSLVLELLAAFGGAAAGDVSTNTNDPANDPVSFSVTGTVNVPQAQLTLGAGSPPGAVIANQSGSVDFGETELNTPVVQTFTVTNSGTGDLVLTDPIYTPYGFSVASDFGATTLAPGASTTFAIQMDADDADSYQGTVAFETSDPDQALFTFDVHGDVAMPVINVSQGSTDLANESGTVDFGNTAAGTPVDETIDVTNTGSGPLTLNDPIQLPAGFSLVSDFGSTSLDPGASTSFTVALTAASAGFYGGNLSFGTNGTPQGTFDFGISGGVGVPKLQALEGAVDVTGSSSALDFGQTVVGTARSETFTVTNSGTADLVLSDPISLPAGFTLVSDFGATTLAAGASTTFTVELTATAAGDDSGSITFGTNLPEAPSEGGTGVEPVFPPGATGTTFSLPVQGEVIGLSDFRLWNDTGFSAIDGHTSDPTVAGNLLGVPDGTTVEVQFDSNGDGTVDGSLQADSTYPFTFTPVGLVDGAVTVDARVHLVDAVLGDLYTAWAPLSYTLETGTNAAPVVTGLALQTVTVPNATPPTSSDPDIIGSVLNDGNLSYLTVEIDTTGLGQADDTVSTDTSGNFVYQPQNLSPGTYTFNFRAVESDYPSGEIVGQWQPFTFTLVAPNPPVVDSLALASVTGPGANTTTDPTLSGHVTADGNPQQVEVDFQYNGDGVVDASVIANADGTFTFQPQGLPLGTTTIQVRAVNLDKSIIGAWTSITFTLAAPQAPTVSGLALLNDTGASATDKVTDDPTVTGTLTGGTVASTVDGESPDANVTVQFDTNGDDMPDGSTVSDSDGNFAWTPTGINPGTVTIAARAITTDPATGNTLIGSWVSLTFTYDTTAGPLVSSLSLVHPTGTDPSTGDTTAIDATLTGSLTNGGALASFLTVQYELNADTTPDGSAMTDAQGNFTCTPSGLIVGVNTVQVRGVSQDPQTAQEVDGPWKIIVFILQQSPINQPPIVPVDGDPVGTGDQIAATSQQADLQAVDDGIQSFNTAMGADATASGQIAVGVGSYTALSGVVGGRIVSGSVFGVENGSLPAPSGVGGSGSGGGTGSGTGTGTGTGVSGPSLSGSSPVGLPSGTPLNVLYLATPVAGSGTIVNQAIAATGPLGPGNADLSGLLNGSWNITVTPDPENSGITDWTVSVYFDESFDNRLSGSYENTAGTATLDHDYTDDTGGSYGFFFQASGTTTVTPVGPIVAGTFTLAEGNSYSYNFGDSPVASDSGDSTTSTNDETVGSGGSHNFERFEPGGKFHVGGGSGSGSGTGSGTGTGGGSTSGSNTDGPTVSSTFIDNEIDTYYSSEGSTGGQSGGAANGAVAGGSTGGSSFSYFFRNFQAGSYTGSGASYSENANFSDDTKQSDTSTETDVENFTGSSANGEFNGGATTTTTITTKIDDSESGNWSNASAFSPPGGPPNGYTMSGTFDDQNSFTESDETDESGTMSQNMASPGPVSGGGISSGGSFTFHETGHEDASGDEQGTDGDQGTSFTADGTFDDSDTAGDQIDYHDGGGYQGTVPGTVGSGPSASGSTSATFSTVGGSYSDGADETDTADESDSGTLSDDNSGETDKGTENDDANSSVTYSSTGADTATNTQSSAGDNYTDSGSLSGSFTNSDTFNDSPTLDSASGTLSLTGTADDTFTESDNGQETDPGESITWGDSVTTTADVGLKENGNYTASETPAGGDENDDMIGTADVSDTQTANDSWTASGTISGNNSYTFSTGGTDSATAKESEDADFDDSETSAAGESLSLSGTFTDDDNASASASYDDTGVTTGPNATVNYTDDDHTSRTGTYHDSGTDQEGPVNDTSATFNGSQDVGTDVSGTADGNDTAAGAAGHFDAKASDHDNTTASETGNYDHAATNTRGETDTVSDSNHAKFSETDSGNFNGGQSGTYAGGQKADDLETTSLSGSTTNNGTTTTGGGTFSDDSKRSGTNGEKITQQQGTDTLNGSTGASASLTYHDSGTYTVSGAGPTFTGTFSATLTFLTTGNATQTGGVNGGNTGSQTLTESDATTATDTQQGTETDTPDGKTTKTGTATDDSTATETDTESEGYPVTSPAGGGSHSDSGSLKTVDRGHADGTFTQVQGAVTGENMNYTDDNIAIGTGQESDNLAGPAGAGASETESDSASGTSSISYHDAGDHLVASTGTTDNGTDNTIEHDTDSAGDQTTVNFNNATGDGTTNQSDGESDTTDYIANGSYAMAAGGATSNETYYEHDVTGTNSNFSQNDTAAGDPGTSINASVNTWETDDDVINGADDLSNGTSVGGSDDYTDTIHSHTDTAYHETSDKQGASMADAPVGVLPGVFGDWDTIPWDQEPSVDETYDFSTVVAGMLPGTAVGGLGGGTGTGSSVGTGGGGGGGGGPSSADSVTDEDSTDILTGGDSLQNGTATSDENFNDTTTYSDSADQSQTTIEALSFTGTGGLTDTESFTLVTTASASDSGTDTSDGTVDNGVTADDYNDGGTETMDYSTSGSYTATASGNGTSSGEKQIITTDEWELSSTTETGDYTTEPPGQSGTITPDNPDGDAVFAQSLNNNASVTNTMTAITTASSSGGGMSVTDGGTYVGGATETMTSNSTVSVDVAAGVDADGGVYSDNEAAGAGEQYGEIGSSTGPNLTVSWTGGMSDGASNYNDDSGVYGMATAGGGVSGGSDTDVTGGSGDEQVTVAATITIKPSVNGAVASTYTQKVSTDTPKDGGEAGGAKPGTKAAPVLVAMAKPKSPPKAAVQAQPQPNGKGHTFVFGISGNKFEDNQLLKNEAGANSLQEFLDMVLEETIALSRSNEEKRLGRKLTPDEDEKAVENAKAAVSVHKFGWQEEYKKLRGEILNGVKTDLGVTNIARANRDDLNGYTVRVVLIGYSYGAASAVNAANELFKAELTAKYGLIVDIVYFGTVDGVEHGGGALTRRPNDPNVRANNVYAAVGGLGGKIKGVQTEASIPNVDHETIDENVLTGANGRALAKQIAKMVLESFPGGTGPGDEEDSAN